MPQFIIDTFSEIFDVVDDFMSIVIYYGNLHFTIKGLFTLIVFVCIISPLTVFFIRGDLGE